VYHERLLLVVWSGKSEHIPFSAPEAITNLRRLRLSVVMDDPGRGISVANKEQRMQCSMIKGKLLDIIYIAVGSITGEELFEYGIT
jgi:hypothetical protein